MLYSIQSTNPNDYGTVSLNLNIPWKCTYVKYYVSSLNTKANILMTTDDDYLLFESSNNAIKIEFKDMYAYSLNYLVNYMNSCQSIIVFKNINNRTISLTASEDISFIEGTHRAKLITGLYNIKNNDQNYKNSFGCIKDTEEFVPDLPILDLANKLYLVSLQGNAIGSQIGDKENTPSVIATIDTMIMDNEALIYNFERDGKPIKIKCNTDSLKYIEMRLVDFMYQPIILKSPLFITLKIKPSTDANVKDIISK